MAHRFFLVGRERVSGFRRPQEPIGPVAERIDVGLHVTARDWRFRKYHFTGGIKIYNAFDAGSERDVQANITSPNYGTFYNPIQRSIGFVVSSSKP